MAISSNELVQFFYGSSYVQAPSYLTLYSVTFVCAGFSLALRSFFNGIGRTDTSLKVTLVTLPLVIPLTPALTWLYGVYGFILALIASSVLSLVCFARTAHGKYALEFGIERMGRICLAVLPSSVPALAVTLLLPESHLLRFMIAGIAFSLAYLTVCPSVGAIDMEDLANLRLISEDMGLVSKLSGLLLSYEEKVLSFTNRL